MCRCSSCAICCIFLLALCALMSQCLLHISVPRWHFLLTLWDVLVGLYMVVVWWMCHRILFFFRHFFVIGLVRLAAPCYFDCFHFCFLPCCVLVVGACSSFAPFELFWVGIVLIMSSHMYFWCCLMMDGSLKVPSQFLHLFPNVSFRGGALLEFRVLFYAIFLSYRRSACMSEV